MPQECAADTQSLTFKLTGKSTADNRKLWALLAVACLIRFAFVFRGGQNFFSDETRYVRCYQLLEKPWFDSGKHAGLFSFALNWPDHPGFMLPGCIAAMFHHLAVGISGARMQDTFWVPALFLSLASVVCIGLTYALARRCDATDDESFLAALLLTCSNAMFMYSRHLLPYDTSLAFALGALYVGLREDLRPSDSLLCGLMTCLSFLIYFGSWTVAFTVGIIHIFRTRKSANALFRRACLFGIGAFGPMLMFNAVTVLAGCIPLFDSMRSFSHTAVMGDFNEGWSLPWVYLWEAEHCLLLVWAVSLAICVFQSLFHSTVRDENIARGRFWLLTVVGMYLLFVIFSVVLHRLVVYGRLIRAMIPFVCLASACSLNGLIVRAESHYLKPVLFILLLCISGFNYYEPFTQRFPDEVAEEVLKKYTSVREDVTVVALSRGYSLPRMQSFPARYVLINAQPLFSVTGSRPAPQGKVLFRFPHPQEYKPFQYDGCTREQREILDSVDMSMRLIDTESNPATQSKL